MQKSKAIRGLVSIGLALAVAASAASVGAAGGFVPPAGTIWVKLGYSFWRADERFAGPFGGDLSFEGGREVGDILPIKLDTEGDVLTYQTTALDLQVSPVPRLTFGAHFPVFQRLEFVQENVTTTTEGTGDLFAYAGYQLTPLLSEVGTALYLHVKLPLTEAQFEDIAVPLSEGQVDVAAELATSWAVLPELWLSGRLLYRYRFEVEQTVGGGVARIKPGNETEVGVSVEGAPFPGVWLSLAYNGLFASTRQDRTLETFITPTEQREIQTLTVGAYIDFGGYLSDTLRGLALDLWYRHPLAGVDYLRGPSLGAGIAYQLNY